MYEKSNKFYFIGKLSSHNHHTPFLLQYDELESLREELKQKERESEDLQSVKVSQAFTDHSITPDSSIMNVRASYTEKVCNVFCREELKS